MIPFCASDERSPSIVCVFPVPVCPYANTVASYPFITSPIIGRTLANTSAWSDCAVKTCEQWSGRA